MFSSPARTPRRSVRPRDVPRGSASVLSDAGSLASLAPSARVAGAAPSARSRLSLAPARRGSPASSAGETVRTVRERADDERVSWSRDARHAVFALGDLPKEVQGLVQNADFIVHSVEGQFDMASGFALVSTPTVCAAWSFAKRTHSPTVYAFPPPVPTRTPHNSSPPPLAAFFAGAGEPGLVLVSATGEVRFWESMSLALANVERYQVLEMALGDELVDRLWKLDASTFIITTTASSAYRLTIAPSGGRVVPTIHPLTRPGGMFGRASPAIFAGRDDRAGVAAVAPTTGGAYVLAKRTLQKWALLPDGSSKEFDLLESIGTSLFDDEVAWQSGGIALELNDLVSVGPDRLAALVSYARYEHDRRTQNSHAIVLFENHTRANTVMISNIVHLSYVAHPDPRLLDVPRLYIPGGSSTAFVRFADAVVIASLSDYAVSLKDAAHNAFIGIGSSSAPSKQPYIVAMPATGGLLAIEVYEGARGQASSAQTEATARLKSKMEQAVFFGDRSDNPLTFDLPPGFQGDLAAAAEVVSAEIVASSSPYMAPIFETRPQLMDRLARLKELMAFIHRNGALSLSSRRRLSRDAEKVKAATELWDYQNRLMDKLHTQSPASLLADAIESLMVGRGIDDEDVVRGFFRTQNLDGLLARVYALFQERARGAQADLTPWVIEANRIFITVLRTASQFREDEMAAYQIDRLHPADEPWTAADGIVDALDALFAAAERLVKERTRTLGSVIDEAPAAGAAGGSADVRQAQADQAALKRQMTELAAALCSNMEDKLRAGAERQMDGGADPNDGLSLAERWVQLKPRVIRPLVDIDRVPEAYELAEHHSDFPTLVYLCHHPAAAGGPAQIQTYIERFGDEFAFVLYQWYIDNGHLHALLSQDEVYAGLLTAFFAAHPHPRLAWLHDLACGRYGAAAAALAAVEQTTAALDDKHLVASLGKLAAVAETKKSGSPTARGLLQQLDNELDFISVQDSVREAVVADAHGSAEAYVAAHAAGLDGRPAFRELLDDCVRRLVAGDALGVEDVVDVLTLKDNTGEAAGDYARALELLATAAELPEGRRQAALLSVWRRVFIRDDWTAISNTKGRSEEAQREMQRRTAVYVTMRAISENADFPPNFVLSPFTATQPPLAAELAARFPGQPAGALGRILDDHAADAAALARLVDGGIEDWVREVGALVRADMDGDVDMA